MVTPDTLADRSGLIFFVERQPEKQSAGVRHLRCTAPITKSGWDEFFTGDDTLLCAPRQTVRQGVDVRDAGPELPRQGGLDTYSVEAVPQAMKVEGSSPRGCRNAIGKS